jgi:transposase
MHSDVSDAERQIQSVELNMRSTVSEYHLVISALVLEVEHLREQMAWLRERLKVDSRNSSNLPYSDCPGSGDRAQRRASHRKRGGHKRHPGTYRELLPASEANGIQDCILAVVCECGGAVNVQGKPLRHQVFDIPPGHPDVKEYRFYSGVSTQCGRGN